MVLFLDESDVQAAVTMDDALRAVRESLVAQGKGSADNAPRHHAAVGQMRIGVQSAVVEGDALWTSAKISVTTTALTRSWTLLFDCNATLLCIAHARRLGQLRTGAATGVSADVLGRRDAKVLTILGTGFHGFTQVEAVTRLRPDLKVIAWGRTPARTEEFAERLRASFGLEVETRRDADQAAAEGDIVVTMTRSCEPVLHGAYVSPGTHVVLAGSNNRKRREADAELFACATAVYTDDIAQAKHESGDLLGAIAEGALTWDRVELLGDAVAEADRDGTAAIASDPTATTVFSSHGVAMWDTAITADAYCRATELGIGTLVPIDGTAVSKER
jgi:ornithine cyclodeaminase/alanine dehydrogenase